MGGEVGRCAGGWVGLGRWARPCLLTLGLSPLPVSEPSSWMRLTVRFVHFSLSVPLVRLCPSLPLAPSCDRPPLCPSPSASVAFSLRLSLAFPGSLFLCLLSFLPFPSCLPPSLCLGVSVCGTLPLHPNSSPCFRPTPAPRLREIPQPEQHRGPQRGVPAPRAPRHPPWLSQGSPPCSPNPALHPLALPSPLWGDLGVTGKKVKGAGGGGWGKGFYKKNQKVINNMQWR